MVGKSFMQSAALAVLAAVGAMAVPAQAQEQNQDRHEARAAMREARQQARAERQEARQEPQVSTPQQAQARSWNRSGGDSQARAEARLQRQWQQQSSAPEGGWRSQRAADGRRYGRDWQNDGTVNRPAPAWRGATPQTPDRGVSDQARAERWGERNRTYTDPNRSTTYGGYRDRTTQTWRDRQGDRTTSYREGYRDGSTADSYRDRRDQTQAYRQGYSSASRDYRRWDRNDWRRDNRYNWSGYRNQHRELYRIGRYYSPYNNYRYSRLNIGFFLQPLFYGRNYWIDDPYQYRLPEAYGPYRWVRYYDDALLVDIYSGEVVDVIYDFFW